MYKNKRVNAITSKVVKFLLGASGFLLLGSGILLGTQANSDPGLVLHYDFEDASNLGKDVGTKANHATNNGVTQVEGRIGKAGRFDTGQFLRLAHNASLDMDAISISVWVKPEARFSMGYGNYKFMNILSKGNNPEGAAFRDYNLYLAAQDDEQKISFIHFSSSIFGWNHSTLTSRAPVDQWNHVVVTIGNGRMITYRNGVMVENKEASDGIANRPYPLLIGKADTQFLGTMDELKIRNYALTPAQIKAEYDRAMPKELVLHYDFEDASNLGKDKSGKGNHGTNHNTTQIEGRVGKAGNFDGNSSYLTVPMTQSLKFSIQHSIGAWVKLNRPPQFDTAIIASGPYYTSICRNTGALCAFWYNKLTPMYYRSADQALPLNKWIYVTTVYEDQTLNLYINGQKVKSFPTQNVQGLAQNGWGLLIGGGETGNGLNRFLDGQIDELKIWNYALTPEQVKAEYDRAPKQELVLHYDFEDASNLGKDSSGKGNHGTNHNTTQTEGRVGKAGKFNGTSSYLTVPMNQSLKFPVQHSIGAWVKLNRAPQFDTAIIASWVGAYYMSICQDTNAFCTLWYEKLPIEGYKSTDQVMPLDTWVYLTTVWGDRTLDMYINGQKVKSFPTNLYGRNHSGIDKLLIAGGETWNGLIRFLDGQIDELKIWNYALTPEQVKAEYDRAPKQELVLHYDFEDVSNLGKDKSGKGNHGTNYGVTQVAGRVGKSANFTTNKRIQIPLSPSLTNITDMITMSAWIRLDHHTTDQHKGLTSSFFMRPGRYYAAICRETSALCGYRYGRTVEENTRDYISVPQVFPLQQWMHATVVYDQTHIRFYINGVETHSVVNPKMSTPSYLPTPFLSAFVGGSDMGDYPWNGQIDEVKVRNYALTPSQIKNEYDRAPKQELVLHYDFEDVNNLGKDISGLANHATNNGVTQVEGRVGKSANFNGVDQMMDLSQHASKLALSKGTISFWAKVENDRANAILAWTDNQNVNFKALTLGNQTGRFSDESLSYIDLNVSGGRSHVYEKLVRSAPQYLNGKWHHYLITLDEMNTLKMFIDGVELSLDDNGNGKTTTNFLLGNSQKLWFGKSPYHTHLTSFPTFKGQIDDLKIWNYALSPQEVQAQYRAYTEPTILITMKSDRGEILGTQKLTATAQGQAFQIGSSYEISAPQLADRELQMRFTTAEPQRQSVAFTADATFHEITFVYSKPELVLHYTFDEEGGQIVTDKSGHGNHGTIIGNPQWDDWGRVGGMRKFSRHNWIQVPASESLDIRKTLTLSAWIKPDLFTTEPNQWPAIIHWPGKYYLALCPDIQTICTYRYGRDHQGSAYHSSTTTIPLNQWSFVTATWDGNHHHIYLNGQLVSSFPDGGMGAEPDYWKYLGIGSNGDAVNHYTFDGAIDDIRVYNFALTAQAVKSLYQSYPAAFADPAFQLDFNLSQTGNITVAADIVTTSKIHLYRPTKNLELRLIFPNEYVIKSHAFPEIDGQYPISGEIVKSRGLTGTTWTIPLKDNLNGIVNASFVGIFDRQTNHLAQPLFEAQLYKKAQQIAQESVVTSIWNPTRFLLWTDERKPGNGYDIEYIFTRHTESIRTPGGTEWGYVDHMGQGIFNLNGYIPLPAKARFVRSSDPGVSYDAQKHALKISNWTFPTLVWNNKISVFIRYEGLQVGETVSAAIGYGTGHLGSPTGPETSFYFGWPSAIVEAPSLQLAAGLHRPQGTVIPDHPNQHLMRVVLSNHGTTLARNLEYEVRLPDGLQAYEVRLPYANESDGNGGLTKLTQPVGFRYETNRGKIGTVPPTYGILHNRTTLGLAADEYFTKLIFTIAEMIPYDRIHGMQGDKHVGLQINGDVAAQYADGRAIQNGDQLLVRGVLTGDGFAPREGEQHLGVSGRSYAPISHWMHVDKASFTQGEKVKVNGTVGVHGGWRYHNGHYLKNPSFFIFVPNGLRFDPKSFRATFPQGGSFSEPRRVTHSLTEQAPADHSLWRVDTQTIIDRVDPAIVYTFELDIPGDAIPGHYTMRRKVVLGSNDPKFRATGSWWGTPGIADPFNLWNQTERPQIAYDNYHNHDFRIVANDFGTNNCLKADKDGQCKSSFDSEVLSSWSNYSSGQTGDFTVKLYNGGAVAANNILYTIQLPRMGVASSPDLPQNEWEPLLYKEIEMSNLPVGSRLEYSVNGIDFYSQYRADAKAIRLSIPTLEAGLSPTQLPQLTLTLQAPTFADDEAYKRAWIRTSYRFNNSAGEYEALVAGLRTVPTNYTPSDDEKYAFCQLGSIRAVNSGIEVEECKALLDLYRNTGAQSRKNRNGWHTAATMIKNFPQPREICSWYGITCNEGKITAINLEGNNLQGQIPASFKALTDLTSLNLSKNPITGFDRALQPLTQLKTLNLSETKVVSFAHLPSNLTHLILNKLALPAKTNLPNLPQLQYLDMSETTWDMDNAKSLQGLVDSFSHLQEWNMSKAAWQNSNLPTFPERIGNLTQLRVLNWKGGKILGKIPASLNALIKLEHFDVSENYLTDPLPNFDWSALSKLTTFDIRNNYIGGLNTKANPLTNKWRAFKPREQWQLIITQGGQRKTEIHDLSADASESLVVKQAQRRDAESLKDAHYDLPSDLRAKLLVRQDSGNVFDIQTAAPNYTVRFANGVPKSGRLTIGVTNHLDSQGMKASLALYPSAEALEQEEKKQRTRDDNASATQGRLNFDLKGAFLDKSFSAVHFNVGGDDFGGGIFWQRSEDLDSPVYLNYGSETLSCLTQLKGFYYNSQRGERLWPLDQTSLAKLQAELADKYEGWTVEGGWYTDCYKEGQNAEQDQRGTAIYGVIKHLKDNDLKYTLVAGAQYDYQRETMQTTPKCNLQMLNNAYPFGYLYDTAGGLATLGMRINSHQIKSAYDTVIDFHQKLLNELNGDACVNEFFDHDGENLIMKGNRLGLQLGDGFLSLGVGDAREILFKLGILGIIGLSDELRSEDKRAIEGNSADASLLLNTDNSIASVINIATKKADALCRDKWIDVSQTQPLNRSVLCLDAANATISLGATQYAGKTIIVKNGNLILNSYMASTDQPTTIFVAKGNLFLPQGTQSNPQHLIDFSPSGYPTGIVDASSSKAHYLKGNFIVNGLILGGEPGSDTHQILNKLIIHGKVASYNMISTPKNIQILDAKKTTLKRIFGVELDDSYLNYLGLDRIFVWSCDVVKGAGSDGTPCKGKQGAFMTDKAFGLIDMTFLSPLFL